ncbi:histidinol dehydrogenase [Radiobacillus kanasensis]|uniref:histidinol dehydrogenase n=1 Tax=Radiobacillus kanasensis TaxID=2844358 RepID=UPI001E527A18|nr:histidinol dehydrogenase [Radiobacillus kanasensis]UFU01162.1 histidinol dehydrogenase [Radiobacillus kanasensis]
MIPVLSPEEFRKSFFSKQKNREDNQTILEDVQRIITDVQQNGDKAIERYAEMFDGGIPFSWLVSDKEKENAWKEVSEDTIASLKRAAENIQIFHQKQLPTSRFMNVEADITSGQLYRAIENVGIYVPGGTASYPSTVFMNAIPAIIAGVERVVMVSPARNGESISPVLLVAAEIAGVQEIYKLGGAQAIAALAYGTESIPSVDKIVGPGNAYVAAAKSLVFGDVGIDMIAGPSEVAIIADETANPVFIAADLIAQAEHDAFARSFLFSTSDRIMEETKMELEKQCAVLPRKDIAEQALQNRSAIVKVADTDEAFQLANQLAPEHLEIQLSQPMNYLGKVRNAGSVFLGNYSPEPLGDYYAGPNHVLPTSGTAKFSSGLSVDDFLKKTTFLYYSEAALNDAATDIMTLAKVEQLEGHARAIQVRVDNKNRG